jgi:uncharacterized Ntn-hydrolase superfamily protein
MSGLFSTFSIVGRDSDGTLGVAVSSRALAVGAHCPFVRERSVAIACQAYTNPYLAYDLLDRLGDGSLLHESAESVLMADEGREWRQVIAIGPSGQPFIFTGSETDPWAGHSAGTDCAAAGNLLVGPETVGALVETFERSSGSLPERLVGALVAGQEAGGDRRGQQSAAVVVRASESAPFVDLRVDDHPHPVAELARLLDLMSPDLDAAYARASTRRPRSIQEIRVRQAALRASLEEQGR